MRGRILAPSVCCISLFYSRYRFNSSHNASIARLIRTAIATRYDELPRPRLVDHSGLATGYTCTAQFWMAVARAGWV